MTIEQEEKIRKAIARAVNALGLDAKSETPDYELAWSIYHHKSISSENGDIIRDKSLGEIIDLEITSALADATLEANPTD